MLVMMKWCVSQSNVSDALNDILLDEDNIETRPEKITAACIDENVNIHRIKKFFNEDGWKLILEVIKVKRDCCKWSCPICCHELEDCTTIACDSCLEWHHLSCVGLSAPPKRKEWFGRLCDADAKAN